jgi:hypothetical protein
MTVVSCDCGCGRTFNKTPQKILRTNNNFYNKEHYYNYMRRMKTMKHPVHHPSMLQQLKFYGLIHRLEEKQKDGYE